MTWVHVALGVTVLALNLVAGLGAFRRSGVERLRGVAAGGHVALGLQVATGFLLFTSDGPGAVHALVPVAALGAIVAVRVSRAEHLRAVLAVSWAAVAAGAFGLATGF